jgi:nitrogen regulatory protein PII
VFVLDLAQMHSIRTGERDQAAVTPTTQVGA